MEKQQVKKYTPDTSCTKIPKQLCAPESCNIVEVVWQRYVMMTRHAYMKWDEIKISNHPILDSSDVFCVQGD